MDKLKNKMIYWLLTDPHLGHRRMQEQEYCQRPEGFEQLILGNVQKLVRPQDVLISLGDFCIYRDEYWHQEFMAVCAGKRWFIRGNHDRKSNSWYLSHGWDFVADEMTLNIFGKRVALSHRPITAHDDFDINIHGHFHNTEREPGGGITEKHRLIFIEHTYTPVNLRAIVEGSKNRS